MKREPIIRLPLPVTLMRDRRPNQPSEPLGETVGPPGFEPGTDGL